MSEERVCEIANKFVQYILEYRGKIIKNISISYGYACSEENDNWNIMNLVRIADARMYKQKEEYYSMSNLE